MLHFCAAWCAVFSCTFLDRCPNMNFFACLEFCPMHLHSPSQCFCFCCCCCLYIMPVWTSLRDLEGSGNIWPSSLSKANDSNAAEEVWCLCHFLRQMHLTALANQLL